MFAIATLILVILLFNLVVRRSLSFERYFRSPFNIWTLTFLENYEVDLPEDLLYSKLDEILKKNGFNLVNKDDQKHKLLAITKFSFLSWGENLYVKIIKQGDKTGIEFCSTSVFSITWGRNKRNFDKLVEGLNNALIV
jgi:hypothetical protein